MVARGNLSTSWVRTPSGLASSEASRRSDSEGAASEGAASEEGVSVGFISCAEPWIEKVEPQMNADKRSLGKRCQIGQQFAGRAAVDRFGGPLGTLARFVRRARRK